MVLLPYIFIAFVTIPCLTIVTEVSLKAMVAAAAGLFGLEVEVEIVTAQAITNFLT